MKRIEMWLGQKSYGISLNMRHWILEVAMNHEMHEEYQKSLLEYEKCMVNFLIVNTYIYGTQSNGRLKDDFY